MEPGPLSDAERRARRKRVARIAQQLGFVGGFEYRHVYSLASGIVDSVGDALMIGTKKLITIRKQIEKALTSTGADPIQRLDRQIASAKRKGDRTEIMEGLRRFLEPRPRRQHRKYNVGART